MVYMLSAKWQVIQSKLDAIDLYPKSHFCIPNAKSVWAWETSYVPFCFRRSKKRTPSCHLIKYTLFRATISKENYMKLKLMFFMWKNVNFPFKLSHLIRLIETLIQQMQQSLFNFIIKIILDGLRDPNEKKNCAMFKFPPNWCTHSIRQIEKKICTDEKKAKQTWKMMYFLSAY